MAWGKSKVEAKPSTISQLLPLIILFVFLGGAAWVGYQIYLSAVQIQSTASERMNKKNVVFTKDGMKVGVKHVENEREVDATQRWAVKAWNMAADSKGNAAKRK